MAKTKLSRHDQRPIVVARQIILDRLRNDPSWEQMDYDGRGFDPYVELVDGANHRMIAELARQVFWQLVLEGILIPGLNTSNPNQPWFSRTEYGKKVLASLNPTPHDPDAYLARLVGRVPQADHSVLAYLQEALDTYRTGSTIASAVMLGIAAERVFLLLCESTLSALDNVAEQKQLERLLERFAMKPKLDWVHAKFQSLQGKVAGFPDNATVMISAIYDLLRVQRNDLGHPRDIPPSIDREDAFVNLQIFPRYYETAEQARTFFRANRI